MAGRNVYDPILGEYRRNYGIRGANATTYHELDGNDVDLYVNGGLAHKWTVAVSGSLTGQPYGLLLALTQP